MSPDPGATGSGSSGAKPRGASGPGVIGATGAIKGHRGQSGRWATSPAYGPLPGGVGVRGGVCGRPCVYPSRPAPSTEGEAGGGKEKECLQGAPMLPPPARAPEGNGWACNQIGLILFGFTWLLLRAECSAEEWGVKGHPESTEGARRIRSGSRAGW